MGTRVRVHEHLPRRRMRKPEDHRRRRAFRRFRKRLAQDAAHEAALPATDGRIVSVRSEMRGMPRLRHVRGLFPSHSDEIGIGHRHAKAGLPPRGRQQTERSCAANGAAGEGASPSGRDGG